MIKFITIIFVLLTLSWEIKVQKNIRKVMMMILMRITRMRKHSSINSFTLLMKKKFNL
jgi:hypothetical protein